MSVRVRNLHEGEAATLPVALQNHGMPYLDEPWAWVIESVNQAVSLEADSAVPGRQTITQLSPVALPLNHSAPVPFALVVCSFAHGWLVLWRVIAISPLPPEIPLTWFKEALPQVFAEARARGCVGFLTLLSDDRPAEAQMARIITKVAGGTTLSFQGVMGVGLLAEAGAEEGSR